MIMEEKLMHIQDKLRILASQQADLLRMVKRYHLKMMEGFRCIEKAFKINCEKQMEFRESLDDVSEYCGTII